MAGMYSDDKRELEDDDTRSEDSDVQVIDNKREREDDEVTEDMELQVNKKVKVEPAYRLSFAIWAKEMNDEHAYTRTTCFQIYPKSGKYYVFKTLESEKCYDKIEHIFGIGSVNCHTEAIPCRSEKEVADFVGLCIRLLVPPIKECQDDLRYINIEVMKNKIKDSECEDEEEECEENYKRAQVSSFLNNGMSFSAKVYNSDIYDPIPGIRAFKGKMMTLLKLLDFMNEIN
jgi:hypothetical protein